MPGSSRRRARASPGGRARSAAASRRPSSAASARACSRRVLTALRPGTGSRPRSTAGSGKACAARPATVRVSPYARASPSLTAAARVIRSRLPITVHAAASYGEKKHTGRRPGNFAWSRPTTGSARPTAGKPLPSTSSDRTRATWARTAAGAAPSDVQVTRTAPVSPGCRTAQPTTCRPSSAGKASRRTPSSSGAYAEGVKSARKRRAADRAKGPSGTSENVGMALAFRSPAPGRPHDRRCHAEREAARRGPGARQAKTEARCGAGGGPARGGERPAPRPAPRRAYTPAACPTSRFSSASSAAARSRASATGSPAGRTISR